HRCRLVRVFQGEDLVLVAPEERGRGKLPDLVRAIEEVHALPTPVDDVADGARDRARAPGLRVHPREHLDVFALEAAVERAHAELRADAHERLADALDEVRERREAQAGVDFFTEAAGRDEREATDAVLEAEQEPLRDAAAEGVTDEVEALETQFVEP